MAYMHIVTQTYVGTPLVFPKLLRSIIFPFGKMHPHAGAFSNGVQVPSFPGTFTNK